MSEGPYPTRTISVRVDRDPREAYDFASQPENVHRWATGLSRRPLERVHDEWIAETPDGAMRVRFSERNTFGVLDHYVIPPSGEPVYIPMRVIANGSGCEIMFTLFRMPQVSSEQFERDSDWVLRDLNTLKSILEAGGQHS